MNKPITVSMPYDDWMRLAQTAEHGALGYVQQCLQQPDALGNIATITSEATRLIGGLRNAVERQRQLSELDAATPDVDKMVREDDARRAAMKE